MLSLSLFHSFPQLYKTDRGYTRHFMLYAFIGAIGLNVLGFLQHLGVQLYCRRVTQSLLQASALDSKSLHLLVTVTVAYDISAAASWFLFSCDALLFAIAFLQSFSLARTSTADDEHRLSLRHGYLGLGISALWMLLFLFEAIAAVTDSWGSGIGVAFGIMTLIENVILIPIWVGASASSSIRSARMLSIRSFMSIHFFFSNKDFLDGNSIWNERDI
jgi:hypothetical protein